MVTERRVAVEVDANVSPFIRGLTEAGAAAKGFASELESADSRMANLVQAGLALAPALVPIGAAAVPAIAGLTEQFGFAAMAAGTAVLAFNGLGDALDALDKYKVAPTAANFAKLQQTMDKLGPAGQEFVLFIDRLEPRMRSLQAVAEAGLLPGVEDGIHNLLSLLPEVKRSVFAISSTLGQLVTDVGNHASDPHWQHFFQFIDTEATPTLIAMGKTLGNVLAGFTALVMDFDPLAQDFTHGMVNMSQAFAHWADGLGKTQGFQEFVSYIRSEGPQVVETLGALGNALIQIVEAAAPVGSVSLHILKDLADVLSAIADSPAGPVLISAAAAVGVLGRSMALLKTVGLRGDGNGVIAKALDTKSVKAYPAAAREAAAATRDLAAAQQRYGEAFRGEIPMVTRKAALDDLTAAYKRQVSAEEARTKALKSTLSTAGKAAGVIGGLAFATSGLADKTGLSNTASLALMGTIAGPWGAAIGGGIGVVMDLASANNDLETAMSRVNTVAKQTPIDLAGQQQAIQGLVKSNRDYWSSINSLAGGNLLNVKGVMSSYSELFTHSGRDAQAAIQQQVADLSKLKTGLVELEQAINGPDMKWMSEPSTSAGLKARNEELSKFASEVAPAAAMAGIDLRHTLMTHDGWDQLLAAVKSYNASMDSATGKSTAVGKALADLGSQLQSDATQADALASSLDSLFGTQVSASEATDQWIQGLKDLRKQIASTNGAIKGNSEAALANRAAIRQSVTDLQNRIAAEAKAGVSGGKLAEQLLRGRDAIIAQAKAAGANMPQVRAYLKTLGMTPKNLKTIIETPGLLNAKQQVEALGRLYGLTPKEVRTLIRQDGMGDAQAAIDNLRHKYDLTPKEVRTLLKALDEASSVAQRVAGIYAGLPRTITTQIIANHYDKFYNQTNRATGGVVYGPGTSTSDSIPAYLSDGEYVVKAAAVDKYGVDFFDRLNAMHFADGGFVWPGFSAPTASGPSYTASQRLAILQAEQQIRQLTRSLAKTGKQELDGLNRRIAQVQLQQAQEQLRQAQRAPMVAQRQDYRTQIAAIRQAIGGFDVSSALGLQPRNPTAAGVRGDLATLRHEIEQAGGTWTKHLQRMSDRMIAHARAIDADNRAITRETNRRDRLEQHLSDLTSQMDNLKSTMSQYGDSVSGNFLTNPFGLGGQSTTFTPTVQNSPALAAATDQLNAAKAHLSSLQSGGGDLLTRLANAAQASRVEQTVAGLQAQVDNLSQPVTKTTDALSAFKDTLADDTKRAQEMNDALKTLASEGLNKNMFGQLAASGDVGFAQELAAAGQSAVDNINTLWNARAAAAAQVAAYATQTVYGQQQAVLQGQIQHQNRLIDHATATMNRLEARVANLGQRVEHGAERGVASLRGELADIKAEIRSIPRNTQTVHRKRGR